VPAGKVASGCSRHYLTYDAAHGIGCLGVALPELTIDRSLVGAAALRACVKAGGCTASAPDGDAPVHIPWPDAVDYCKWRGGHLPTEAEWERARETRAITPSTPPLGGEWLAGWYTYLGPDGGYKPGALRYNARLVITIVGGASYVYGGAPALAVPGIVFRCAYGGNPAGS
jgi:hypothetical protein